MFLSLFSFLLLGGSGGAFNLTGNGANAVVAGCGPMPFPPTGGTQSSGGLGGVNGYLTNPGGTGGFGVGGFGNSADGGGGGGGWYGGGGGGAYSGGAGGSSHCNPSVCLGPIFSVASATGDGYVTITFSNNGMTSSYPSLMSSLSPTVIQSSAQPSVLPTASSAKPSAKPTALLTPQPSAKPSNSFNPTLVTSNQPSKLIKPTISPTSVSTIKPSTSKPTAKITPMPTAKSPTASPTTSIKPHSAPSALPTATSTSSSSSDGGSITFFDASQSYQLNTAGKYSNSLTTQGYVFTYSQDKVLGRPITVTWPTGLEMQSVSGVPLPATLKVQIFISFFNKFTSVCYEIMLTFFIGKVQRVDLKPFTITTFTVRLICSTLATGASIEVDFREILAKCFLVMIIFFFFRSCRNLIRRISFQIR